MKFKFNPLYSMLAIMLNMTLVWYFNTEVSIFPLYIPNELFPATVWSALGVQFVISSLMPGVVGPMAQAAGNDVSLSLREALVEGSIVTGGMVAGMGGLLHYIAGTPNFLVTVLTITSLTVVPCALLVMSLRFFAQKRGHVV